MSESKQINDASRRVGGDAYDAYDHYEREVARRYQTRDQRRKRKPKATYVAKMSEDEVIASITEETRGLEGGFDPTYTPSRHEEGWIMDALRDFYDKELIVDVLAQVKGGKEANVYCCRAHPGTGVEFMAAKVYRPRMLRNLRNDARYRQGRILIDNEGRRVKGDRAVRALAKNTGFGAQLKHTSWMRYEFETLETLYAAGAPVPRPWLMSHNALLMAYVGDGVASAPVLHSVALNLLEAERAYRVVLRAIETMLQHEIVHGDLSAFNILYWNGGITLIDFPQAINPYRNDESYDILRRDIVRVCDYFARQGVATDPERELARLWQQYLEPDAAEALAFVADLSRDTSETTAGDEAVEDEEAEL